ncbi:PIN-like domain-containing protein [Rhizobium sp. No.120]
MRNKFPGYYKLTDFGLLWKEAVFVLDTSVLLNLYRYPKAAREQTLAALEKLKDRLWIPYHVALEFQRNRLNVIHEQNSEFDAVLQKIGGAYSSIKSLAGLKDRHSLIDPTSFIQSIREAETNFRTELEQLRSEQAQVNEDDPTRAKIDDLLDGKVGEKPSQEAVAAWQDSGKKRYSAKIPPGYMDLDKEKENEKDSSIYTYGGIEYHRIYGDLIIWNQIIDHCKVNNIKKVIFVTNDNKADWWLEVGGKTIGPRPELVEEIGRLAGVTHFHMYRPDAFLTNANEYIGAEITAETIGQVRDISRVRSLLSRLHAVLHDPQLFNAISVWLTVYSPGSELIRFGDSGRYLVRRNGIDFPTEIIDLRHLDSSAAKNLTFDKINYAASVLNIDRWSPLLFFVVVEHADEIASLQRDVESLLEATSASVTVYFAVFAAHGQSELRVPSIASNLQESNAEPAP